MKLKFIVGRIMLLLMSMLFDVQLSGNIAASKYFWQKLTPEEKDKNLVRTTGLVAMKRWEDIERTDLSKSVYTEVLCFLLLQMNEEQQKEAFEENSFKILNCFLDWPWQIFFLEMAERMWSFLSEQRYHSLLKLIIYRITKIYKNFDYQTLVTLFGEFWQRSPITHKQYVILQLNLRGSLLSVLFKHGEEDLIELIFKDATASERKQILISEEGKIICQYLILNGKLNMLKFFVVESLSSKDAKFKFRDVFKKLCRSKEYLDKENDTLNEFFRLLDELVKEDNEIAQKLVGF